MGDVEDTLAAIGDAIWDWETSPDAVRFNAPAEVPRRHPLEAPMQMGIMTSAMLAEYAASPTESYRPPVPPSREEAETAMDRWAAIRDRARESWPEGYRLSDVVEPVCGRAPRRVIPPAVAEAAEAELARVTRERVARVFDVPAELLFSSEELDRMGMAYRWRAETAVQRPEGFVMFVDPRRQAQRLRHLGWVVV
jgi:hypothetical protein